MIKHFGISLAVIFTLAQTASAQTAPKTDTQSQKSETSKSKTSKSEISKDVLKSAPKTKSGDEAQNEVKREKKPKDVEAFFRDAEKQMEDGPSCQPPPEPIV